MNKIISILIYAAFLMNAKAEKLVVGLFSEVRIEVKDADDPASLKVEYGYKSEGHYIPEGEAEILAIEGLSQTTTFHSSKEIHPATGKPYYIAVLDKGKLNGSVIKFYKGEGSGFYLIQGLKVDEQGSLVQGADDIRMSPLTSKPFADLFQKMIPKFKVQE